MSWEFQISPFARNDANEAYEWYEDQRAGLSGELQGCIREAINRIRRDPESYAEIYNGTRQLLVDRFPYSIIFCVEEAETVVYSIHHRGRDSSSWTSRI